MPYFDLIPKKELDAPAALGDSGLLSERFSGAFVDEQCSQAALGPLLATLELLLSGSRAALGCFWAALGPPLAAAGLLLGWSWLLSGHSWPLLGLLGSVLGSFCMCLGAIMG